MSSDRVIVEATKVAGFASARLPPIDNLTDAATVLRLRNTVLGCQCAGKPLRVKVAAGGGLPV
jgi:hypothetical protein